MKNEPITLTNVEIQKILPHRYPFLLIDKIVDFEEGKSITGIKNVTANEPQFTGHFPGNPVVPGVILCEMMGQASCVLLADKVKGGTPYFTKLDGVKFKKPVLPGDTLETVATVTRVRAPFYFISTKGYVNGKLHVQAEMSFAVK